MALTLELVFNMIGHKMRFENEVKDGQWLIQ
jgi:hypothetical protein